jgi:hypothetical protein
MGTPHQGGNGVQLGRILANLASLVVAANDGLLKHLERDSEWLQQQLGQYASISNDFVTKYAFEEYATPTLLGRKILVRDFVRSTSTGADGTKQVSYQVVPKASAVVLGHADAEAIAIHADHTSMVRYPSKEDAGYVTVSEHLRLMTTDATDSVKQRWEGEERADNGKEA